MFLFKFIKSLYYNILNYFEYLDLNCNASYCDKKLGHCVHGNFNHCIEKPAEEGNEKPKVKMHVRLSVWMDDACQEEEDLTKIIELGDLFKIILGNLKGVAQRR